MRSTRSVFLLALLFLLAQAVALATAARYRIKNRYLNSYAKVVQGADPQELPIVADNNPVGADYSWDIISLDRDRRKYRHYEIKHLRTNYAAAGDADKGSGSRVVAVPEKQGSAWLLSPRFNDHNPTHSFVIYLDDTDLVWTLENGVVRLRKYEGKPNQLWAILQERNRLYDWLHQQ
ncbi:hypothetical protein BGW42_003055 [Actinomortierella wolfii]|nr:hypothetical protein BGW42_003055 [Actinomortierella wolfii]